MSGQRETAQFDLVVNGGEAQRALDQTRASALGLGGGLDRIITGLDGIGGKQGKDATNAVRSLSFALGSAGGTGAEFLGVVGDMADLVTGGALVGGLALLGIGVAKVAEVFEEAAQGSRNFDTAIVEMNETVRRATEDRIAALTAGLVSLRTELGNFGKDARQIGLDAIQAGIAQDDKARPGLASELDAARARAARANTLAGSLRGEEFQDEAQTANNLVSALEARLTSLDSRLAASRTTLEEQTRLVGDLDAREVEAKRQERTTNDAKDAARDAKRAAEEKAKAEALFNENETQRRLKQRNDLEDEARRASYNATVRELAEEKQLRKDADRERERAEKETQAKLQRIAEEAAAAKKALHDQEVADMQGYANVALGIGIAASQQFIDAVITGQDHATERVLAGISKRTGAALIGLGQEAIGKGIFYAADPLTAALAPSQFVVGAALIGGGLTLGAVGTGIETAISGSSAGAAATVPIGEAGASERGVGAGGRSSSRDEGALPITIVFEYGVGPTPEKMSRDLAAALGHARSHRILRDGVRR